MPKQPTAAAADGADAAALAAPWDAWRAVVRAMSLGRLIGEVFFWRGSWTQIGADYVTGLRGSPSMRRVSDVLAPLSDADLKRVYAISKINHHRLESWARWMAVGFITAPVSVVLTLKELDPQLFDRVRERLDTATLAMLGLTAIAVLYQIISAWRALRIATAIDFVMVERGLIEDWQAG